MKNIFLLIKLGLRRAISVKLKKKYVYKNRFIFLLRYFINNTLYF